MKVKDLMIPVDDYKTVKIDTNLGEVATLLSNSEHRDVVVVNEAGDLEGVLTMTDILIAMEPNYKKLSQKELASDVLSNRYVADLFKEFNLWGDTLGEVCKKAVKINVSNAMYVPTKGEYMNEEDDLEQAIHRYITGIHQPIIVKNNGTITGVLRLSDVFKTISERMVTCVQNES